MLLAALAALAWAACAAPNDGPRARPEWRDPFAHESIASGRDDSRLVLLVERGIPVDANRLGGGIRLHRYSGGGAGRQTVWTALLSEFSGLKFPRQARLAVVDDQVVVEIAYRDRFFAVDFATGSVRPIDASDRLVRTATDRGAWTEVRMLEPERPLVEPQTGRTGPSP